MRRVMVLIALVFAVVPLSAQEQGFKNVKLLKDLTPGQFGDAMDLMRASLGVGCDYCHEVKGKEIDFASDAKEEKKTAREMIQIVFDTNEKFFNKRPVVTCNTCHRGSTNPVGLVSLPQAVPVFPTPERKRPTLPTRDEIVAKYAAAFGKADKSALATIVMKGTRKTANGESEIEVSRKDGKMRSSTPNATMVLAPTGAWSSNKENGTREMSAEQREQLEDQNQALQFVTPEDVPADARVVRKDKINDREVYVLQSSIAPKVRQRLYFDAENGLLVRRVLLRSLPIGDTPTQIDYSDYREAGGFKLPHTIELESADPYLSSTRHFSEIHPNAKVDDKIFELPKS
ncbi:MAG TPA: c-type cytochrome [Thermoanaerobaculia bacterium]|nr:c-type cytochrome [Thermoanaerobaculia bacterium]